MTDALALMFTVMALFALFMTYLWWSASRRLLAMILLMHTLLEDPEVYARAKQTHDEYWAAIRNGR